MDVQTRPRWWSVIAVGAVLVLAACGTDGPDEPTYLEGASGDADRGQQLIRSYGCQTCHVVPGVDDGGRVGPELGGIARQDFIAGVVPNSPANMAQWIRNPQSMNPQTAMPTLGVTEAEAEDIVAYLATLD